jgi:hypothetical protein
MQDSPGAFLHRQMFAEDATCATRMSANLRLQSRIQRNSSIFDISFCRLGGESDPREFFRSVQDIAVSNARYVRLNLTVIEDRH